MHELSLAREIVTIATAHARANRAERVRAVTIRVGALSCVYPPALSFCFDQLSQGTVLDKATLNIVHVPIVLYCAQCQREVECPTVQRLCCPVCGAPSGDVRAGRDLEVESIAIEPLLLKAVDDE